eukprot:TRINITY_DN4336_c0_g1_i3.p1 TRINITY_DN4336_c0_g1~~TRINITY_DN4336_c0_g1_i3.p1  ORF type:complete len:1042 (-),score=204.44 TRINITY_DN4336_c0_g1_i3:35-3109(-)
MKVLCWIVCCVVLSRALAQSVCSRSPTCGQCTHTIGCQWCPGSNQCSPLGTCIGGVADFDKCSDPCLPFASGGCSTALEHKCPWYFPNTTIEVSSLVLCPDSCEAVGATDCMTCQLINSATLNCAWVNNRCVSVSCGLNCPPQQCQVDDPLYVGDSMSCPTCFRYCNSWYANVYTALLQFFTPLWDMSGVTWFAGTGACYCHKADLLIENAPGVAGTPIYQYANCWTGPSADPVVSTVFNSFQSYLPYPFLAIITALAVGSVNLFICFGVCMIFPSTCLQNCRGKTRNVFRKLDFRMDVVSKTPEQGASLRRPPSCPGGFVSVVLVSIVVLGGAYQIYTYNTFGMVQVDDRESLTIPRLTPYITLSVLFHNITCDKISPVNPNATNYVACDAQSDLWVPLCMTTWRQYVSAVGTTIEFGYSATDGQLPVDFELQFNNYNDPAQSYNWPPSTCMASLPLLFSPPMGTQLFAVMFDKTRQLCSGVACIQASLKLCAVNYTADMSVSYSYSAYVRHADYFSTTYEQDELAVSGVLMTSRNLLPVVELNSPSQQQPQITFSVQIEPTAIASVVASHSVLYLLSRLFSTVGAALALQAVLRRIVQYIADSDLMNGIVIGMVSVLGAVFAHHKVVGKPMQRFGMRLGAAISCFIMMLGCLYFGFAWQMYDNVEQIIYFQVVSSIMPLGFIAFFMVMVSASLHRRVVEVPREIGEWRDFLWAFFLAIPFGILALVGVVARSAGTIMSDAGAMAGYILNITGIVTGFLVAFANLPQVFLEFSTSNSNSLQVAALSILACVLSWPLIACAIKLYVEAAKGHVREAGSVLEVFVGFALGLVFPIVSVVVVVCVPSKSRRLMQGTIAGTWGAGGIVMVVLALEFEFYTGFYPVLFWGVNCIMLQQQAVMSTPRPLGTWKHAVAGAFMGLMPTLLLPFTEGNVYMHLACGLVSIVLVSVLTMASLATVAVLIAKELGGGVQPVTQMTIVFSSLGILYAVLTVLLFYVNARTFVNKSAPLNQALLNSYGSLQEKESY